MFRPTSFFFFFFSSSPVSYLGSIIKQLHVLGKYLANTFFGSASEVHSKGKLVLMYIIHNCDYQTWKTKVQMNGK